MPESPPGLSMDPKLTQNGHQIGLILGPCWGHLEIILGSCWGHLGIVLESFWVALERSWDHLGAVMGDFGVVLVCFRHEDEHTLKEDFPLGHVRTILGHFRGILSLFWATLGLSWAI